MCGCIIFQFSCKMHFALSKSYFSYSWNNVNSTVRRSGASSPARARFVGQLHPLWLCPITSTPALISGRSSPTLAAADEPPPSSEPPSLTEAVSHTYLFFFRNSRSVRVPPPVPYISIEFLRQYNRIVCTLLSGTSVACELRTNKQ